MRHPWQRSIGFIRAAYDFAPMRSVSVLRRRVLVVDTNFETMHSIALVLLDRGHNVAFALNAYSALETAQRFVPHVVLLDLALPRGEGLEVARRLKRLPQGRGMRIVALASGKEDPGLSLDAGCEQQLLKPLNAATLEQLLEKSTAGA